MVERVGKGADAELVLKGMAESASSAISGLGPLLMPFAELLTHGVWEEWQRNASRALNAAERVSGLTREELAAAIQSDPTMVPLMTRVLFQAGMTGQDEKLQALGAGLGYAVRSDGDDGTAEMLLVALEGIGATHIAVLRLLTEDPPPFNDDPESASRWSEHNLPANSGLELDATLIAVQGLINAGLVRQQAAIGGQVYEPTQLGRVLLDVIDEVAE